MAIIRVSEKGQITIPAAIRRALGIIGKSKVEVMVGEGEIILRPIKSIKDVKGIFTEAAEGKTADWDTIRRETMKTVAAEVAEKTYDCIEMKHIGGQMIYEKVKDMTREEELAYWKARTEELRVRLAARKSKRRAS